MKKELRPVHDHIVCDVCGRTILKGERTEPFLAPGGHRRVVCELCFGRAEHHGWIREAAAAEMPSRVPRAEPRRSLLSRLGRRRERPAAQEPSPGPSEPAHGAPNGGHSDEHEPRTPLPEHATPPPRKPRTRPKDPRHVRAVPTTAGAKVERALELFNGSDHQRTISGLARTLGAPWVRAMPDPDQPAAVTIVVAWELSWYRYRIDLGDESQPVDLLEKGEQLDQIEDGVSDWNGTIDANGNLVAGQAVTEGGSEG
ncbi:MAG TPA: hypothetical protein VGF25_15385 [Thermoleophilaceae bacterium]